MPEFFKVFQGRRVLVTGHTGFKGAWLCAWLETLGAEVTGFALPPHTRPSLFEALGLARRVRHIVGDIRDAGALTQALKASRAEFVFHLAAQALVRVSYEDPKGTFDTNIGGTVNMLEALRTYGKARVFIAVTSDKCYENREWVWGYRENDPLGGHDPYSASKGCAELVFAAYARSFFTPGRVRKHGLGLASVRAGNVLGGGDWAAHRVVPDCIRALSRGKAPGIRNPGAVRPWQHVLEPLGGYLRLAAALAADPARFSGPWNFGPAADNCRTVRAVAEAVVKAWGRGRWRDLSAGQQPAAHEAQFLRLCCDKAAHLLGWKPVWGFDETIRNTVDWYKAFYAARPGGSSCDRGAARRLCEEQIAAYGEEL